MMTRASGRASLWSARTKRFTLEYRAVKPWSSTRSCQMAIALRPRWSASSMTSRCASQALAVGLRPGALGGPESVDTSMAGFEGGSVDGSMAGLAG